MNKSFVALALTTAVVVPAWAAPQSVTLSVAGMTCSACPIVVKQALGKVKGVMKTDVSFDRREAVVSFDDTQTNVQALTKATTEAGFPSEPKK